MRTHWMQWMAWAALMVAGTPGWAAETTGAVRDVDVTGSPNTIEVRESDGTVEKFVVSDAATISREGKDAKLSDLKTGDKVQISHDMKDGDKVASAIMVLNEADDDLRADIKADDDQRAAADADRRIRVSQRVERTERDVDMNRRTMDRTDVRYRTNAGYARATPSLDERLAFSGVDDGSGLRIIPSGTMRPAAWIGGPSVIDGDVRAAAPPSTEWPEQRDDEFPASDLSA